MAKNVKSKHRVPVHLLATTEPVTPEYQAEVDRSTEKLEREYVKAQNRLAAIERRVERAISQNRKSEGTKSLKVKIAAMWEEVEARRQELIRLEKMMTGGSYQGKSHQGTGAFTPTTAPRSLL